MGDLPECCYPSDNASMAEQLYCAFNASGERPGLNYQDLPCPMWDDLPKDVKAKWQGTAMFSADKQA